MQGATGPAEVVRSTEFPKVVLYRASGDLVVMGVRINEVVTLEQVELMDEAGILIRWAPGPGVEPGCRWKEVP